MWRIGETELTSRLLLGTAGYNSPKETTDSIVRSGTQIVTVSLRRQAPQANGGSNFWQLLREQNVRLLPNTAGCKTARDAVTLARMSRELFSTNWIKLEVTADEFVLEPDPIESLEAARELVRDDFEVFAYTTDSLALCEKLFTLGCRTVMPWASPIGSGRGARDIIALEALRSRFPTEILIVDAGIGKPSHAAQVMELGFDAVLLNSAVALAHDSVLMAQAFKQAIEAGRSAYVAGMMPQRAFAVASTPVAGTPFATFRN